jgi:hypothetical protein
LVDAPRQARDKCVNLAGKNATTAPATSGIALPQFNPLFTPPRTAIDGMIRLFRPRSDGPVRYL